MKTLSNLYLRIGIATGSLGMYVAAFFILYPSVGSSVAAFTVFPAAVAGWLLGIRGGLPFGLISLPLNIFLFRLAGDPLGGTVIPYLSGSFAVTLIGITIGWVRGLLDRVREQAGELREERKILQEEMEKRIQAEERLIHEALHDPLTNLPNRRLFFDRLAHAIEWNKRHPNDAFAVMYLDFDRFKVINDSLGHDIGDRVLVEMARRLKASVRATDTVARIAGDEFVVLLESARHEDEIFAIVKRIRENLAVPFEVRGNSLTMTASIGVVMNLLRYQRIEDIIRDADIAMYSAKLGGKDDFKVFDLVMREQADDVLKLESGLRRALQDEAFRIHYQPIFSLMSQKVVGFEALLRWKHPERGLLYPADFMKAAEESGLIVPIGQWVMTQACRQMREWQTRYPLDPPLSVSVNLSSRQFAQPDLVRQIEEVLEETGLPPESLLLELTEMTLIEDIETAVAKIEGLHALGVGIELDDFGTGYSSLGYLRHLPVNNLKIDRSFISALGANKSEVSIVRAIIAMANSLDMKVIAEGIETEDQITNLLELACDYGQGFFFNTPMESSAAQELIEKNLVRGTQPKKKRPGRLAGPRA